MPQRPSHQNFTGRAKIIERFLHIDEPPRSETSRRKFLDTLMMGSFEAIMVAPTHSHRRIRLFRSAALERLTVVSAPAFILFWSILLPGIAATGTLTAPTPWAPAYIISGLVGWTITEYLLHRFVFHLETDSTLMQRVVFVIHGNHHADPNDPLRNLMPPVVSLPVGGVIWAMSFWAFGAAGTWFFFGFMVGYVGYDLVHYACHQFPMKGRIGRLLKGHHMRHHHLQARGNYAITGMIWDRILSTRISSVKERR